tara:strand:+ start:328 stop:525 length:198 start_codon:yes stop_codon:yes gene_type:complete
MPVKKKNSQFYFDHQINYGFQIKRNYLFAISILLIISFITLSSNFLPLLALSILLAFVVRQAAKI